MYSKKKLWSNFRLLVDTANKEIEKKLLTRRSYPQQHFKNLYGSSSIMNLGCLKSPLIESKKLKTKDPPNPNWSIMNFGRLKSPLIESEKLKTNDPPNPNGSSSIMKFCCLKSPLIESEKLKTKDPPNPNWSSSILNFGCLKSPLVESEKLKTNDPPNPNGSSLIMNFGCLQSPLVESEKLKTNDPPSPNGSSSIMNFGCLKSPLVESEKTKTKEPPNPNDDKSSSPSSCLTEITSRKRRAENQRKSKGGFKKAKIGPLLFVERKIPDWIFQVMRNINGDVENPRMLFERTLTESDVKSSQSRLLIPFSMLITEDFLTPEEARAINKEENKQEDENVGVGTIVVNERSQKWGLRLKIWSMEKKKTGKGTLNYALNWGWNEVVEGNNLKAMDKIGLWTFRCRGVLCFALDLLERVNSIDQ